MSEDLSERTELIASISSQVADGVGPLISQIVEKRFREEKQTGPKTPSLHVPTLSHPGLNAQASLLSKWIADIEQIETIQEPDELKERMAALKKNLKRRLTTVVGADSDAAIFNLADAYEKVEAVIDQSDEFGKAVADHLKRTATIKSQDARKRGKLDQPFRKGGYPGGAGVPASSFQQQPNSFSQSFPAGSGFPQSPMLTSAAHFPPMPYYLPSQYPIFGEGYNPFYSGTPVRRFTKPQTLRSCYNCGQGGHIAAACTFAKKTQ